jgi:hypothetical protein
MRIGYDATSGGRDRAAGRGRAGRPRRKKLPSLIDIPADFVAAVAKMTEEL